MEISMLVRHYRAPHRARGQGSVEFGVIFMLFILMMGGVVEMTYLFRAKQTLDHATFQAARSGATNNARLEPMRRTLARYMAPLYTHGKRGVPAMTAAVALAEANQAAIAIGHDTITVISPTVDVFNELAREQKVRTSVDDEAVLQTVLPNDNLNWRDREVANISVDGFAATVTLQDANLLKIRGTWCYRLVVPGVDRVIWNTVNAINASTTEQDACNTLSLVPRSYYLAISSTAVTRMQSAVVNDGNNLNNLADL